MMRAGKARLSQWNRVRQLQRHETFRLKREQAGERYKLRTRQMGYMARITRGPGSRYPFATNHVEPSVYAKQWERHDLWMEGWEAADREQQTSALPERRAEFRPETRT